MEVLATRKWKTDQEKSSSDFKHGKYQKESVEHSNLPSKEQLPVDYSIGKFFLLILYLELLISKFMKHTIL